MFIAKVVGTVVATRKDENLVGLKLMVVRPVNGKGQAEGQTLVAVDSVGAGVGETVLVVKGSPARLVLQNKAAPVDAAIVGIVDEMETRDEGEGLY